MPIEAELDVGARAPFHGEDPVLLLQRFDALSNRVKGAEQLLKDLAAGESTTRGAIGEISYIEMLLKDGYEIERVADWVNGKKAADIILKDATVIDVKYYDWTNWRWRVDSEVEKSVDKMVGPGETAQEAVSRRRHCLRVRRREGGHP